MASTQFDVFLSHNSRDKPVVERIAALLKEAGLEPWLDRWYLLGGDRWQQGIGEALRASAACAVFYGAHGLGDWQQPELDVAQDRATKEADFRLVPVLLPGAPEQFEPTMLPPFLSMLMWVDLRQGVDDPARLEELLAAIRGTRVRAAEGPAASLTSDVAPYQGLHTFEEEDAEFFFGREADVQRLLEKLKGSRFLAVVGPSGSGKSSLVRAGLLPALRANGLPGSGQWEVCVFKPGAHPLTALAAHLGRLGHQGAMQQTLDQLQADPRTLHLASSLGFIDRPPEERLLLVVDQFEEVFTLCRDEAERAAFLANLLYAAAIPDGRCTVVLTLRADFYPRCAAYPDLASRLGANQYLVSPLVGQGLRDAITKPATRVGLSFEPGLVERILQEVQSQPGALPLLEHALLELWERRRGNQLTLAAYEEIEGVAGALAKRADASFAALTPGQQAIARRAMLRLTQPGEGTEDTRRRAELEELATRPEERDQVQQVVDALVADRLLTTSGDERTGAQWVDVAHEALIRGWPRLRQWLEEDRQGLLVHRRLTEAAHDWQQAGEDPDLLYRGARLSEAQALAERQGELLNALERQFLVASAALRQREIAVAEEVRLSRERLRRRVMTGLAGFSVIALALALLAGLAWQEAGRQTLVAVDAQASAEVEAARAAAEAARAEAEAARAESEARVALSRGLAAQARALEEDHDLGLLLAAEGYDLNPEDLEVRRSLLAATHAQPRLTTMLHGHTGTIRGLAMSPDGTQLASGGDDGTIRLWDPVTTEAIGEPIITGHSVVWDLAFRPDGQQLAAAGVESITLWNPVTRAAGPKIVPTQGIFETVAFSPDGRLLASATTEGIIELWDPETGAAVGPALTGHEGEILFLAFTADGSTLVSTGFFDGTVRFWDVAARRLRGEPLATEQTGITGAAFTPDGAILATGGEDGSIRLWDAVTLAPIGEPLTGPQQGVAVGFGPDGAVLYSAGPDGTIQQWDVASRQSLGEPIAGQASTHDFVLTPDGMTLATGGADRTIRLWDVAPDQELFSAKGGARSGPYSIAYSPDGGLIATGHVGGEVLLWDAEDGSQVGPALRGHGDDVAGLGFSPDGTVLASASFDRTVRLWDVATGETRSVPLLGHESQVNSVAFSPDGEMLATGSDDGTVRLWHVSDGTPIGDPFQSVDAILSVHFTPDGRVLAAVDDAGAVHLWNPESGEPVLEEPIQTGQGVLYAVCFTRNGREFVTAGADGTIRSWDADDGSAVGVPIAAHEGKVLQVACHPDGSIIASLGEDGRVLLWRDGGSTLEADEILSANAVSWQTVAFSSDGSRLVSIRSAGSGEFAIHLWDVEGDTLIRDFPIQTLLATAKLSPDGSRVAAGSQDGRIALWDAATGTQLAEQWLPDDGGIWRVAFSPDGTRLALGTVNGAVRLWDGTSASAVGEPLAQHDAQISALAFSADGTLLASGADDGTVQIWNTTTHQPLGDPFINTGTRDETPVAVPALGFSSDGSLLAVSGFRTIRLWDVDRAAWAGLHLSASSGDVSALAFSPDGTLLASAGYDAKTRLWDITTGQVVAELPLGSTSFVYALTFSPDGSLLAAADESGAIAVWDFSQGRAVALGELDLSHRIVSLTFVADGMTLTSLNSLGVVSRWDLSGGSWRQQACAIANRNLTRREWRQYIGDPDSPTFAYHATCIERPLPLEDSLAAPVGADAEGSSVLATPVALAPLPAPV